MAATAQWEMGWEFVIMALRLSFQPCFIPALSKWTLSYYGEMGYSIHFKELMLKKLSTNVQSYMYKDVHFGVVFVSETLKTI